MGPNVNLKKVHYTYYRCQRILETRKKKFSKYIWGSVDGGHLLLIFCVSMGRGSFLNTQLCAETPKYTV